jgi:L-methionine (R)-S-oxide reductase
MDSEYVFSKDRTKKYKELAAYLNGLLSGETNAVANLSNASALINLALENVNWVGFYIVESGELVLGPFQGKPACIRIKSGRGVCGTAVAENSVQLVDNVHAFPGHIACDGASVSELVVPIHNADGSIFGVLDIDSPIEKRFDNIDSVGLRAAVNEIERSLNYEN